MEISLLGGIFSGLEIEPPSQLLSQAKSLEDLRIPKDEGDQQGTFDYQVCCLLLGEQKSTMCGAVEKGGEGAWTQRLDQALRPGEGGLAT